ncbi:MAG: ABC transporter related protein [Parcubacteria group bacterium GW2011_GWC1_43_61]|nr:MAG: ABC transporter related protein [Parcubacteria group bacterium GW2011_GWC1_43_61]
MKETMPILEVKNLSVSFDKQEVLKDVSFSVDEGDVLAIIGPNGAGKSVLFRALLGLIPFGGEIKWRFFILKSRNLFFRDRWIIESISHELKSVGLNQEILGQQLANLSRGQFQRVLIAWAILKHPSTLLFDEPTAGIDLAGEDTVYNLLRRLRDERGMTILIISHDLNIVYRYADKVLCLNKEMLCFGAPQDALTGEQIGRLYGEGVFNHHEH